MRPGDQRQVRPAVESVEIRVRTVDGEEIYAFTRPAKLAQLRGDPGVVGAILAGHGGEDGTE